jgi:hypothetical protein
MFLGIETRIAWIHHFFSFSDKNTFIRQPTQKFSSRRSRRYRRNCAQVGDGFGSAFKA